MADSNAEATVLISVKAVLGIPDISKDNLLNVYISRGSTAINKYMNASADVDVPATYPDALVEYVAYCYRRRGNEGIKQFMQGPRSGLFESDGLPQSVKDLLPAPYIQTARARTDYYVY